jgi:hypothetical protein
MTFASTKWVRACAWVPVILLLSGTAARAEDPRNSTSLRFAPAKAAFYGTSLRHKEMLQRMTASKAYQRMTEHKVLDTVIKQGTAQYSAMLDQFKTNNPEAWLGLRGFYDEGLALLGDMMSHECFWYGGEGWVKAAPQFQAISNKVNALASQLAQMSDEERNEKLLEILDDSEMQSLLGALRTPETVMGFKVTKHQLADDQLVVIALGIKQALASNPEVASLQKIYKKETISGGAFHVFTLDLSLLTPEIIEKMKDSAGDEGEQVAAVIGKLKNSLKNLKLVISLGRIGDYMIVSIANDNQHLANWGKEKLLIDMPEFAPLKKAGDKKFTDISYTSKEMMTAATSPAALEGQIAQIRQLREQLAQAGVSGELPITEESIKKITEMYIEDMEKIKEFALSETNPRAALSFTYDVASGFETMSYQFGEDSALDDSEELTILSHVGAEPLFFGAIRGQKSEGADETIDYVANRMLEFADAIEFGDDEESQGMQEILDKAAEKGKPIVKKFVKITTEQILPALEDGQAAFVLDASLTTDRLSPTLPPSEEELLLPEVAIVMGVSDAKKLKEGLKAYLALGRELIAAIREVNPDAIPEGVTIPDPEVVSEDDGELASYAIPSEEEFVGKILFPTFGLGEDVAVLALHRNTAKRLLRESELDSVAEELEAALEKPLAGASQFDFNRVMDLIESYLAYASQLGAFDQAAQMAPPFSADDLREQTSLILDFLRCYERTTSVTYIEDGATVTRSISVFSDYEEEKDDDK